MNFLAVPKKRRLSELVRLPTVKIQKDNKSFLNYVFLSFVVMQIAYSILVDFLEVTSEDMQFGFRILKAVVRAVINLILLLLFYLHSRVDHKNRPEKSNRLEICFIVVAFLYYAANDIYWLNDMLNHEEVEKVKLISFSFSMGMDTLWRFFIIYSFFRNSWIVISYLVVTLVFYVVLNFVYLQWLFGAQILLQAGIMIGVIMYAEQIKMNFYIENRKLKFQDKVHKGVLDSLPESTVVFTDEGKVKFINKYMMNMFGIKDEKELKAALANLSDLKFTNCIEDEMIRKLSSRNVVGKLNTALTMPITVPLVVGAPRNSFLPLFKETLQRYNTASKALFKKEEVEEIQTANQLLAYLKNNVHNWRKNANFALVFDTKYQHAGGTTSSIELKAYVFHDDGEVEFILIFRDTTDRDRIMTLESENATYRNNVIASFSHELRTPLNSNLGFLEYCMSSTEISEPVKKEFIEPAYVSAQLLYCLVSDILDYSQFLNGKLQLKNKLGDIENTIVNCTKLFENRLRAKGVALKVDVHPMDRHICTDHRRLFQVLSSLLSNALKFTSKGQVTVRFKKDSEEVYKLSVTDTGIGMDEETQHKLRKNMDSLELKEKVSSNSAGVGIGLFISNILAYHFAPTGKTPNLRFESKKDEGTCFYFFIENKHSKRWFSSEESSQVALSVPSILSEIDESETIDVLMKSYGNQERRNLLTLKTFSPIVRRKKVLIIDDEVFNLLIVETFCKSLGVVTERAFNGKEALDKVKEQGRDSRFRLILTDINMPIMDGYEMTVQLRNLMDEGIVPDTRIVGVTAYVSKEKIDKCYKVGMDDVLNKPLDKESLFHVLKKYGVIL